MYTDQLIDISDTKSKEFLLLFPSTRVDAIRLGCETSRLEPKINVQINMKWIEQKFSQLMKPSAAKYRL